jgi:hypothetical protein
LALGLFSQKISNDVKTKANFEQLFLVGSLKLEGSLLQD